MIKLSFRSQLTFPCNEFAAEFFNGGGHMNAAGGEFYGTRHENAVVGGTARDRLRRAPSRSAHGKVGRDRIPIPVLGQKVADANVRTVRALDFQGLAVGTGLGGHAKAGIVDSRDERREIIRHCPNPH